MPDIRIEESKQTWAFERQKDVFVDGNLVGIVYWTKPERAFSKPGWVGQLFWMGWCTPDFDTIDEAVAALVEKHLS